MVPSTIPGSRTALASMAGVALLGLSGLAQAAPRDPSGVYLTDNGKARIRVEHCGPQNSYICGYAVWLRAPVDEQGKPKLDFRNPDPKKQARPSLGHQLILGLKPNAEGRYEGQIYNAESGKYYDVTLWTEGPGEVSIRGCMMGFLCGSEIWKQKTDIAQGQLTGPVNGANGPRADAEWAPRNATAGAGTPSTTGTTGPGNPRQAAAKAGQKPAPQKPAAGQDDSPED